MKTFNKFSIWLGRKLIDIGFGILLKLDDRDWNPKKECYPASVKQLKYLTGIWFVTQGITLESKGLDKQGWPGYKTYNYYDKNFHIRKNTKKNNRKFKDNGYDDFNDFFKGFREPE